MNTYRDDSISTQGFLLEFRYAVLQILFQKYFLIVDLVGDDGSKCQLNYNHILLKYNKVLLETFNVTQHMWSSEVEAS